MSRGAVETVIGKAVVDGEFRKALFADPDHALAGYDLTREEIAGLKVIDSETLELMAGTLDQRISKMLLPYVDPFESLYPRLIQLGEGDLVRAAVKGTKVAT